MVESFWSRENLSNGQLNKNCYKNTHIWFCFWHQVNKCIRLTCCYYCSSRNCTQWTTDKSDRCLPNSRWSCLFLGMAITKVSKFNCSSQKLINSTKASRDVVASRFPSITIIISFSKIRPSLKELIKHLNYRLLLWVVTFLTIINTKCQDFTPSRQSQ